MKMATGAGKTTVMAMLIAWHTVNAVRASGSSRFSKGFLIITPGITIRDRLRVLRPEDPDSYYASRELVPPDMLADIAKAKIVITNYHAFESARSWRSPRSAARLLQGRGEPPITTETEGEMLERACGELLTLKNVVVINDEAHHCYRERPPREDEETLRGEEKDEAAKNNEAARLWISGIEALKRKVGVRAVYDLSATPFFLRGSGYREGTLFPWVVSDFSLMDAIECGIVKLPRVPVADNLPSGDMPIYRNLWQVLKERGRSCRGRARASPANSIRSNSRPSFRPRSMRSTRHYKQTFERWSAGIAVPPVFIVVCSNTATSKLVYEWISGFQRKNEDGEPYTVHKGHLELFRNFDEYGNRLPRPNTLLIDSEQIESGDALDPGFRETRGARNRAVQAREGGARGRRCGGRGGLRRRTPARGHEHGRQGRPPRRRHPLRRLGVDADGGLGHQHRHPHPRRPRLRHAASLRAGRRPRAAAAVLRAGPEDAALPDVEYADILGIPFDFTAKPVVAPIARQSRSSASRRSRSAPRWRSSSPASRAIGSICPTSASQASSPTTRASILTPENVGPCTVLLQGIVGEGVEITPKVLEEMRPSTITFHLAKRLIDTRFRDAGEDPPCHLFGRSSASCAAGSTRAISSPRACRSAAVTYLEIADKAAERIYLACQRVAGRRAARQGDPRPLQPARLDALRQLHHLEDLSA